MLFTFHKNRQPYFEWKGETKALFSIISVHIRGQGKFAFSAEMVHNRVERIGKALCSPTVNLLRRGLLDHCMETEYGTIKWTSNVWLSDGYKPNDNITVSIWSFRPTERTEISMSKQKTAPRIPLYSERREPESKDNYIYGSEDASEKENDSLAKALSRYLADSGPANKKVSVRMLHTL